MATTGTFEIYTNAWKRNSPGTVALTESDGRYHATFRKEIGVKAHTELKISFPKVLELKQLDVREFSGFLNVRSDDVMMSYIAVEGTLTAWIGVGDIAVNAMFNMKMKRDDTSDPQGPDVVTVHGILSLAN